MTPNAIRAGVEIADELCFLLAEAGPRFDTWVPDDMKLATVINMHFEDIISKAKKAEARSLALEGEVKLLQEMVSKLR